MIKLNRALTSAGMNTRLVVSVLFVVAVAVNTATAQDTTTAAPTTTINATEAPPLTPNTTVEFLNVSDVKKLNHSIEENGRRN